MSSFPSVCLSAHLSVHPSIRHHIHLSVHHPSVILSIQSQFMSALEFKSVKMTYSLKSMHPWFSNFTCIIIKLQGFRIRKFSLLENPKWPQILKIAKSLRSNGSRNLHTPLVRPWCSEISKWKRSVVELGHRDLLTIYSNQSIIYVTLTIKGIQMIFFILWNHCIHDSQISDVPWPDCRVSES